MSSNAPKTLRPFPAKQILFAFIAALALFVVYNNERFIVDHGDPQWTYYLPVRWLLLPHGLAGLLVLCLGATQFSTRLRRRHARVHRILGRCYVIGVAIAAPLGIYITALHNALPTRIAVTTQALLWMLTTGMAFYCIRRRNFEQHRHWMIRSYAVTLIFLTDRVLVAIPWFSDLDGDTSPSILFMCNIIAWVVPTFIVAWPSVFGTARPASLEGLPPS